MITERYKKAHTSHSEWEYAMWKILNDMWQFDDKYAIPNY